MSQVRSITQISRRSILKGAAAGTVSLNFVGFASAEGRARYVVEGGADDLRPRLERAGYAVQQELAGGRVLLVLGPEGESADIADVNGVNRVVRDVQFALERPELVESADETADEPLFDLQWDKQVTEVPEAHDATTGTSSSIAIIGNTSTRVSEKLGNSFVRTVRVLSCRP